MQVQTITNRFVGLPSNDSMASITIRVVAQRDSRGEWCAVFGADAPAENPELPLDDQEVFYSGFKLPRETAQILFPNISGKYRE